MNPNLIAAIFGKGISLPKGEMSLREISESMALGLRPAPEFISLPKQFIKSAAFLISETNKDNRERGFPLISNTEQPLLIPKERHWAIGDDKQVAIKPIIAAGYKNIGMYHTHPYNRDLGAKCSLHVSPTDIISFLRNPGFFYSIVGAPDGTFLMMLKTEKTPRDGLDPIEVIMGGSKNVLPANAEQIVDEIFKRNKSQYSGWLGTDWINLAMVEVKTKFGLEFYCTEPRASAKEEISTLLCKVDTSDGGFRSNKK